ncbi:MAG: GIY-YIG nuclease family protein [Edaphobacter sp.]
MPTPLEAYVYILSNGFKRLYIGVTTDLMHRVTQHKSKIKPESHTAKYNINKLVYFERFTTITAAIQREKQLKGWLRTRKLDLIISTNPLWQDLSEDWGKPITPFQESELKSPTTFRR